MKLWTLSSLLILLAGCSPDPVSTQVQLRDIALACHKYESKNLRFPFAEVDADSFEKVSTRLGWRVQILPFLGEENLKLYNRFNHNESWDSPHNLRLVDRMPDIFKSRHQNLPVGKTLFAMPKFSAENAEKYPNLLPMFAPDKPAKFGNIHDGSSNTIMIIELNPANAMTWTAPADWNISPDSPKSAVGNAWPDRIMVAFCDGSTLSLRNDISEEKLLGLATRAGGEIIDISECRITKR